MWFSRFYTAVLRETSLLVQPCIVHFGLPQLWGVTFTTTQSGILTFSLNSAAYISEIFRGRIQAIDKGQYETAMSLGVDVTEKADAYPNKLSGEQKQRIAREVSDRICFIDEGRILEDTTPEIFFANPGTERAGAFFQKVL